MRPGEGCTVVLRGEGLGCGVGPQEPVAYLETGQEETGNERCGRATVEGTTWGRRRSPPLGSSTWHLALSSE